MSQKIISLGKHLVEKLDESKKDDLLSRWMAHYVAEQIESYETLSGAEKEEAGRKCFSAILDLWERRPDFPKEIRPFENWATIVGVLKEINPDSPQLYFTRERRHSQKIQDNELTETEELMACVQYIDYAARVLIANFLEDAIEIADDKDTEKYLEFGQVGSTNSDIDAVGILKAFFERKGAPDAAQYTKAKKQELEQNLQKLDDFISISKKIRKKVYIKLGKLSKQLSSES